MQNKFGRREAAPLTRDDTNEGTFIVLGRRNAASFGLSLISPPFPVPPSSFEAEAVVVLRNAHTTG